MARALYAKGAPFAPIRSPHSPAWSPHDTGPRCRGRESIALSLAGSSSLVTGWSSTIVVVSFLCGMNMLMTGIMGLYVGRIHAEVKRRPLYVVSARVGFEERAALAAGEEQGRPEVRASA